MRIGLKTPIVVQFPSGCSPWEQTGTVADLVAIARAADELGFDHLTCSEHVAIPSAVAAERGATYWDPIATLGHLAAVTQRIRMATSVMVLGYHHPLALAKRAATLDRLSGGRLVLGVGVGSLREEFDLLGAEWAERGAVADDALGALRAGLSNSQTSYAGSHFSFADFVSLPQPIQPRVPIWVGGKTLRSLRRAVTAGDGWMPFGLVPAQLRDLLARVEVPADFEIVLSPEGQLDPLGAPEHTRTALTALADAGATLAQVGLRAESADHFTDQLKALSTLADTLPGRNTR